MHINHEVREDCGVIIEMAKSIACPFSFKNVYFIIHTLNMADKFKNMFHRILRFSKNNSFFLFGAPGTGKTFLLKKHFSNSVSLYIDLLDPDENETFSLRPKTLVERLAAAPDTTQWVIIDEIQKIPKLLDLVHQQIESSTFKFALSGSSARKLKHGGANLLAGRAFVYSLFPLTAHEIGSRFSLQSTLEWGTLPGIFALNNKKDKQNFLRTYAHTYLREEIIQEQIVRKLDPFRRFLNVAAQMSGRIINFSKIARETGASTPTIQTYFQILEDTLVGFLLEPFHESIRKRQSGSPKFYFFDTGVQRALENMLTVKLKPQTYAYGMAFEHFIINEIHRLQSYAEKDFRLSYLRTKDGVEIDLIIERPGLKRALVEIKSSEHITEDDLRPLQFLSKDISNSEAFCLSLDTKPKRINGILCLPWQQGLTELGTT